MISKNLNENFFIKIDTTGDIYNAEESFQIEYMRDDLGILNSLPNKFFEVKKEISRHIAKVSIDVPVNSTNIPVVVNEFEPKTYFDDGFGNIYKITSISANKVYVSPRTIKEIPEGKILREVSTSATIDIEENEIPKDEESIIVNTNTNSLEQYDLIVDCFGNEYFITEIIVLNDQKTSLTLDRKLDVGLPNGTKLIKVLNRFARVHLDTGTTAPCGQSKILVDSFCRLKIGDSFSDGLNNVYKIQNITTKGIKKEITTSENILFPIPNWTVLKEVNWHKAIVDSTTPILKGSLKIPVTESTFVDGDVFMDHTGNCYFISSVDVDPLTNKLTLFLKKSLRETILEASELIQTGNTGFYMCPMSLSEEGSYTFIIKNPLYGMENTALSIRISQTEEISQNVYPCPAVGPQYIIPFEFNVGNICKKK